MLHQMRAEYGSGGPSAGVKIWHMVREGEQTAMCGREIDPGAAAKEPTDWGSTAELCCHTCGAVFLREAPYLPAEHQ
ncbi:hypothetical protein ACFRKE_20850 [Kitasatospora indigofera]|uniref:Uncharacterized protein n=1 Tax=Kitasatospora indigofera TaxID=67307 RepID=A0A919FBQ1_9ACTN|nr:hypothetical protein [Kitasatospora indigofera]GHH60305.1 hypothetical protein GCM10018781_04740 [Kitasatospora indigofera]